MDDARHEVKLEIEKLGRNIEFAKNAREAAEKMKERMRANKERLEEKRKASQEKMKEEREK